MIQIVLVIMALVGAILFVAFWLASNRYFKEYYKWIKFGKFWDDSPPIHCDADGDQYSRD